MIRRIIVFWLCFAWVGLAAAQEADFTPINTENAADLVEQAVLTGHSMPVMALSFDAVGRYLASGADDISVRVWDVAEGEQIAELYPHTAFVRAVAFSPVDDVLLSGSWDRRLAIFNTAEMPPEEVDDLSGYGHIIEPIVFTPSGEQFAFGVGQGEIHLLNSADYSEDRLYTIDGFIINGLTFSPAVEDATMVLASAAGFPSNAVEFWAVDADAPIGHLPQDEDAAPVTALAFSPTATAPYVLVTGDETAALTLWAVEEADGTVTVESLSSVQAEDWVSSVVFHPDGEMLATATLSGAVSLWDVRQPEAPELLFTVSLDSAVNVVTFNAEGTLLAAGADDGTIHLWGIGE